jgi:Xaa-Pro dipeptidase
MATVLDVAAVQASLVAEGLDGWLLYDFHGINPIAADVTGVARQPGHLATRRWYYLIPATGEPRKLVHAIEAASLAHLPGTTDRYARREQLEAGLTRLVAGLKRVAMEYSPGCAIPYIARVDAGTIELIRQSGGNGLEIVSSGDLIQRFSAIWHDEQIATHREASEKLHRIKDRAFDAIARRVRGTTNEYEIQQLMAGWFADEGLVTDSPPNVSVNENAGNPHYLPTADTSRPIGAGALVLLDLWGKLEREGSVYADITWVGFTGKPSDTPQRFLDAFRAVREARDAGVTLVQERARAGRDVRGWEVDCAASSVLRNAGYGDQILHRTGHSLGEEVHGTGVNMDDYETHDDRRLLPGTGFTIEPGVYFQDFGVRTEINMIVYARDAVVTGPLQTDIVAVG